MYSLMNACPRRRVAAAEGGPSTGGPGPRPLRSRSASSNGGRTLRFAGELAVMEQATRSSYPATLFDEGAICTDDKCWN